MATKIKRILPSEAAAALGSIKSAKKAASSAANGIKTRWQAKPLEELACTCGKCPDSPKTYCPRGRAIIRRHAKANPPAWLAERGNMTTTNNIEYSNVATDNVESFAALAASKRDKLRALMVAPEAEREAALQASAPIAAAYYETATGREELADWRAIQGEPFHD